jgi:hypothetical protein
MPKGSRGKEEAVFWRPGFRKGFRGYRKRLRERANSEVE